MNTAAPDPNLRVLNLQGRSWVLAAAFLGWMFAGIEMSIMIPATRPAIQDFLTQPLAVAGSAGLSAAQIETSADKWLSWFITAFLLGAATGGVLFGWLGDRAGRVKAMGLSILCYSMVTGLSYFAHTPEELLAYRFVACLGIGGMWPNGVALLAEAWPSVSRPVLAGLIGSSANIGFLILGILMFYYPVTKDTWRWVLLLGGAPVFLGLLVLWFVPESPSWLTHRSLQTSVPAPIREVFRPPLLRLTLLGIALGTIPLLGGWASGQRLVPWAGQVADQAGAADLKAATLTWHAMGAVIGSLLGGWFANTLGARRSYFLISLGSLGLSLFVFGTLKPMDALFLPSVFVLGLISTSFYGWLPYYLPNLFPTSVRATGAGVSFNFGRIFSAIAIGSSTALSEIFGGDISKMGAVTSLIYAAGLMVVWFIPGPRRCALSE